MQGIDFENVLEYARFGIRRASLFMGFAVRMAENPTVRDFDLTHQTKLRVLATTEDETVIGEYKHEFRSWVIANALRELHESFTEYLEKVYQACLTFEWVLGAKTPTECDRLLGKFKRAGFPEKLEGLREQFAVATQHEGGWVSLNAARNCFTHRRGIVEPADFNDGSSLRLSWRALDIYVIPADGKPILNRHIPVGGVPMEGAFLESKYVDRVASFTKGQIIELDALQLAEICFFAEEAAVELAAAAVERARARGINIAERPRPSSPATE